MDLKELSQLDVEDLKNIDWIDLKNSLFDTKDKAIAAAIIAITLLLNCFLVISQKGQTGSLRTEITNLEEKAEAVENLTKVKKEMEDFAESFPKQVPEGEFMKILTDFANANNVRVISITPDAKSSYSLYDIHKVRLRVVAEDYADLWKLMYTIERSPYAFRIEQWDGNPHTPGRSRNTWNGSLNSNFLVGSLNLKDSIKSGEN